MPTASSTVADPRILAVDQARARNNISHRQLCEFSGVHPTHWEDLRRGAVHPTDRTVRRLEKAARRQRATCPPSTLADFFWTIAGLFAEAYGLSPEDVFSGSFGPGVRSRCRRLALYVMTVELCVSNVDLARALGQSRQNIKKGRDVVEERRDDPAIDALLDRITRRVRWQAWHPAGRKRRGRASSSNSAHAPATPFAGHASLNARPPLRARGWDCG